MSAVSYCDVCGKAAVSIEAVSSGIAPVSYGACCECIKLGAENIGVVSVWLASYGGPNTAPEFSRNLVCAIDGEYKEWPQIREYYNQNEEQILDSLNEEFQLEDDTDWEA